MDQTIEVAQKGAISGVRWVQWFFSVGKRVDHAALAAAAAALILLRSPAAQHLARQQSKLGRTFRTLHLFVPRFPLFFVLAILFLWRSWRERQLLALELKELSRTRVQLQSSVSALQEEEGRLRSANDTLDRNCQQLSSSNSELLQTESLLRSSVDELREQNTDLAESMQRCDPSASAALSACAPAALRRPACATARGARAVLRALTDGRVCVAAAVAQGEGEPRAADGAERLAAQHH